MKRTFVVAVLIVFAACCIACGGGGAKPSEKADWVDDPRDLKAQYKSGDKIIVRIKTGIPSLVGGADFEAIREFKKRDMSYGWEDGKDTKTDRFSKPDHLRILNLYKDGRLVQIRRDTPGTATGESGTERIDRVGDLGPIDFAWIKVRFEHGAFYLDRSNVVKE